MVAFIDVLKGGEEVVTIGMSKKECVATKCKACKNVKDGCA